mmetsp:Transcript_75512/g.179367  ORF Transcript_75512/g.179367 Transcript_75512/m.179367 type:complete len:226 (-) Transcript_75512:10-687(-)
MIWPYYHGEPFAFFELLDVFLSPCLLLRKSGSPFLFTQVLQSYHRERIRRLVVDAYPKVLVVNVHDMVSIQCDNDSLDARSTSLDQINDPVGILACTWDCQAASLMKFTLGMEIILGVYDEESHATFEFILQGVAVHEPSSSDSSRGLALRCNLLLLRRGILLHLRLLRLPWGRCRGRCMGACPWLRLLLLLLLEWLILCLLLRMHLLRRTGTAPHGSPTRASSA